MSRFIQIHTLTSYPASLLNRDDVGFAKRIPFGNAERNSVRGDAIYQLDMALSKSFNVFKDNRIELRVEAFNVLNKTNFRAPNGNRSSAAFGTITATYDPRQIQLGAKFLF